MQQQQERLRISKIVEVAEYFLEAVCAFKNLYRQFSKDTLRFKEVAAFVDDRGESILFKLKEASHFLFRNHQVTKPRRKPVAGVVFHGAKFGRGAKGV